MNVASILSKVTVTGKSPNTASTFSLAAAQRELNRDVSRPVTDDCVLVIRKAVLLKLLNRCEIAVEVLN